MFGRIRVTGFDCSAPRHTNAAHPPPNQRQPPRHSLPHRQRPHLRAHQHTHADAHEDEHPDEYGYLHQHANTNSHLHADGYGYAATNV